MLIVRNTHEAASLVMKNRNHLKLGMSGLGKEALPVSSACNWEMNLTAVIQKRGHLFSLRDIKQEDEAFNYIPPPKPPKLELSSYDDGDEDDDNDDVDMEKGDVNDDDAVGDGDEGKGSGQCDIANIPNSRKIILKFNHFPTLIPNFTKCQRPCAISKNKNYATGVQYWCWCQYSLTDNDIVSRVNSIGKAASAMGAEEGGILPGMADSTEADVVGEGGDLVGYDLKEGAPVGEDANHAPSSSFGN
ncbi:hypothetical protein FCM35_KLT16989 [Carex littledalei]|uniref:Uncharacterized protein n=1 Tax=Carex littledalei TaxID=544730 RepID=A0A833RQV9_9POAL|nr:hypothetical protein FCM35_KLT16989 [Carex littledalei]